MLLAPLAIWDRAHAACKAQSVEMPVKMIGSRATATVGINGTQVPLTVDSGAFFSILTDAAAEQLKLTMKRAPGLRVEGISGKLDARTTMVDKLQFLKGDFDRVQFIVGGNEPGAGTMGLMGRNILSVSDTEYDLAHGIIRFLFPTDDCADRGMAYWAGETPVSELELDSDRRSNQPAIRVKVKLNGTELVALFDTGATTLVSVRAARRAGVAEADLKPAGTVYGAGRGTSQSWTAPFETFTIGREVIRNNRLRVADIDLTDADMLLGIDFFLSHRIYISKQQSRMYVTYNGGPVFALGQRMAANNAVPATDPAAVDVDATTADDFARRGAASASRRDFERALADLDRACELAPTSAAYIAQRGVILESLRRPVKALADFDRALELDATLDDARYRRATLRIVTKDRDGARADLDALDRTLAPQAQMRLPMANLYLALEQPAQALAQLDQWLPAHQREVGREGALNRRCWARVLLASDLDKALGDCDDAIDLDAKNFAFLDSRGWVYLGLGKLPKALADFNRSIEIRPANAFALFGRGLVRNRMGDATNGEADLAAARKLQPDIDRRLARIAATK